MDIKQVIKSSNETFTKRYCAFSGRASSSEYWSCTLYWNLIGLSLFSIPWIGPFLTIIFCLVILLPALGVTVRRLHDRGMSAWWLLTTLLFGELGLMYLCYHDGDKEANAYGEPCD